MDFSLIIMLEALIIAATLSADAFAASFAYGSSKIKIPMSSVQVINFICTGTLGLSLLIGTFVKQYIPSSITIAICFTILFISGLIKLLDSIIKSFIKKHSNFNKKIKFSMFDIKFIIRLYANPEDADVDLSKTLSPLEAVPLAIALSLDGLAVGFGAALGNANLLATCLFSLITNTAAVILGCYIGNRIAQKAQFDLSWLSGVVLIILAFLKL